MSSRSYFSDGERGEGRHLLGKERQEVEVSDGRFQGRTGILRGLEFTPFGKCFAEVEIDGHETYQKVRAELLTPVGR